MTVHLCYPFTKEYPITQIFGVNPQWYSQYSYAGHNGVDFGAPIGTPILASADGIVDRAGWDSTGYGNYVRISHNNGEFYTYYAHMMELPRVQAGDVVDGNEHKQTVLGYVGSTGNSTGPHLHWELRITGKTNPGYKNCFNPLDYLNKAQSPTKEPVITQQPYSMPCQGIAVTITEIALNVRSGPKVPSNKVMTLLMGDTVYPDQLCVPAKGYLWAHIEKGWFAIMYNGSMYAKISNVTSEAER
jgi:hypothetical protein